MDNALSKISLIAGFTSSVIGYSFHKVLWFDAFYHFLALSLMMLIFSFWAQCKTELWKNITWVMFLACVHNVQDEISGLGSVFSYWEYIYILLVFAYVFRVKLLSLIKKRP
jgi:hypothetical protein